jgi:hypothetical protein
LRDYFAGIAEYAFQTRVGIADPALIDYISDLLIRFIRADSLYKRALIARPGLQAAIETALSRSVVTVLTGPRQCGKTTLPGSCSAKRRSTTTISRIPLA